MLKNICVSLLLVFCAPVASFSATATSLSQHGITWTFAAPVQFGQFVNGDYWVVDAGDGVKITNISPGHALHPTSGRHMHGSMLNPATASQGYDGYQNYDAAKNVGLNISEANPLILQNNSSLVSTISNLEPGVSHLSYVNTAAVLTCLPTIPPPNSFRPGISGSTKTVHNAGSLNLSLLKNLTYLGTKPNIATYSNYLKMVWLTHNGGWTGRYMRPSASGLDNYYYNETFAIAAVILHLDYTDAQKFPLLINFVQLGIDIYSYIESGAKGWPPDGGHSNGRKWPILFAGIILDYAPMKNIGQRSGDYLYANGHGPGNPPADYVHFGEDGQTFYVAQSDVDITNGPTWNPDKRNIGYSPYTSTMIGMPEWGIRYSVDPTQSDASWTAEYRGIYGGPPSWAGTALAAYFMNAKALWNHNAFFDFVDRYMAISSGNKDPFGYTVPNEQAGEGAGYLWTTYRGWYPTPPYARRLFRNVRLHTEVEP